MRSVGQFITHALSGVAGTIDACSFHPDGSQLVRVNDHWLFAADTEVSTR